MEAIMIRHALNKSSILISIILICFFAATAFAEIKVSVNQSIVYADGKAAITNSPIIDLKKVLMSGGKLRIRYDFTVKEYGFFDSGSIYIFMTFPNEYKPFTSEKCLKTTALHGAKDVSLDLLRAFSDYPQHSSIQNSVGRLPKVKHWVVRTTKQKGESEVVESIEDYAGFSLKMQGKEGNVATIEFYLDFAEIQELQKYAEEKERFEVADWIKQNMLKEIAIDINFYNPSDVSYNLPKDEHIAKDGYDTFYINFHHYPLFHKISNSNHSYTIIVQ